MRSTGSQGAERRTEGLPPPLPLPPFAARPGSPPALAVFQPSGSEAQALMAMTCQKSWDKEPCGPYKSAEGT